RHGHTCRRRCRLSSSSRPASRWRARARISPCWNVQSPCDPAERAPASSTRRGARPWGYNARDGDYRRASTGRRPPMTVANGREFLAIPGPTNIPDAVLAAMHRPATDIYSGDMLGITRTLLEDLPKIFRTTGKTYIYAANGHGGWEAAITNVLSRGETILVLESGLFAVGWGEMARMMGVKVEVVKGDWRRATDPAALTQRLQADAAHEIKAVLVVQIDTASGIVNDIAAIRRAIDAAGHPALL